MKQAQWPTVTCHQLFEKDLVQQPIVVTNGSAQVPDGPEIGYEVDWDSVAKLQMAKPASRPEPERLIEAIWSDGKRMYTASNGKVNFMLDAGNKEEYPYYGRGASNRPRPIGTRRARRQPDNRPDLSAEPRHPRVDSIGKSETAGYLTIDQNAVAVDVLIHWDNQPASFANEKPPRATGGSVPQQYGKPRRRSDYKKLCQQSEQPTGQSATKSIQVDYLLQHADIGLVGSWLTSTDEQGTAIGLRHYPTDSQSILCEVRRRNPIAQPAVCFRRSLYDQFGGFPEGCPVCQDYASWSLLVNKGARFANLDTPLLRYRQHAGSIKSTRLRETLEATIRVKRQYWANQLSLGDRVLIAAERGLRHIPATWVTRLFTAVTFKRLPNS